MGRLKSPQDRLVCEDLLYNRAGAPPAPHRRLKPHSAKCTRGMRHESMCDYRRSVQGQSWHAWTGTLACRHGSPACRFGAHDLARKKRQIKPTFSPNPKKPVRRGSRRAPAGANPARPIGRSAGSTCMKQEVKWVPQRDALIFPRLLEGRLIFVALPVGCTFRTTAIWKPRGRWPEIRRCESNRSSKNRPISIKESPTHLSGTLPQKGGP